MGDIVGMKHIYEFDLKQFFPSVCNVNLIGLLTKVGFPDELMDMIWLMHRSQPSLPEVQRLDESVTK